MLHRVLTAVGILALALAMGLWTIMTLELKRFVPPPLEQGSTLAEVFARPPAPSYQYLYVFNLINYQDLVRSDASTPAFRERGPYVFRIDTTRSLDWSGEHLSFKEKTAFTFMAKMSKGTLDDVFTTVNLSATFSPVKKSTKKNLRMKTTTKKNLRMKTTTKEIAPIEWNRFFFNVTVSNYFYSGFSEKYTIAAPDATLLNKEQKVAFLARLNSSEGPLFTVSTKPGFVNQIITSTAETQLTGYTHSCSDLHGKIAGIGLLPAFSRSPATVQVYEPTLSVPWTLRLQEQYNMGYEQIARFTGGPDMFNSTPQTCSSDRPTNINGTFDASPYYSYGLLDKEGHSLVVPAVLSFPHFLYGDPALYSNITGFKPSEDKDRFYIDVHAASGLVVDMKLRTQLNIKITLPNRKSATIFPVFWREISRLPADKEKMVAAVREWPIFAGWVALACSLSLVAAALLFGASIFLQGNLKFWEFEDDKEPHTPDDIPTDELSSESEEDLRREQRRRALRARLPAGLPVYFKIHKGDLDNLGVTIPDWVLAKIQRQIEEQESSSSSEESSDEIPSAAGSASWSTVSSRSTSPEQKGEPALELVQSHTSSSAVRSSDQHETAIADQEENEKSNGSCPEDIEEEVQNEESV